MFTIFAAAADLTVRVKERKERKMRERGDKERKEIKDE